MANTTANPSPGPCPFKVGDRVDHRMFYEDGDHEYSNGEVLSVDPVNRKLRVRWPGEADTVSHNDPFSKLRLSVAQPEPQAQPAPEPEPVTPAFDPLAMMIAWEGGDLSPDETVALFQHLIDTGLAWRLQGCYGRAARDLVQMGLCTLPAQA